MSQTGRGSEQEARYAGAARQFGAAIARLARGYEADPEEGR
jgi:hypothetical protein